MKHDQEPTRQLGGPELFSWILDSDEEHAQLNTDHKLSYSHIDPQHPFDPVIFKGFPAIPCPINPRNPAKVAEELLGLQTSWGGIIKNEQGQYINVTPSSLNPHISDTKQVDNPGQIWILYEHAPDGSHQVTGALPAHAHILQNLPTLMKDKKILSAVILPEPYDDYQNLTQVLLSSINTAARSNSIYLSPRDTKVILGALRATYFTPNTEGTQEIIRFDQNLDQAIAIENASRPARKSQNVPPYDPFAIRGLLGSQSELRSHLDRRLTHRTNAYGPNTEYPINEYLKTNPLAQTLLLASSELLLRGIDFGIGSIPIVSALYDVWQFTTKKEIPFPQFLLDQAWKHDVHIPSRMLKNMKNARAVEATDMAVEVLLNSNIWTTLLSQVPLLGQVSEAVTQGIKLVKRFPRAIHYGDKSIILNGRQRDLNEREWLLNPKPETFKSEAHKRVIKPAAKKVTQTAGSASTSLKKVPTLFRRRKN